MVWSVRGAPSRERMSLTPSQGAAYAYAAAHAQSKSGHKMSKKIQKNKQSSTQHAIWHEITRHAASHPKQLLLVTHVASGRGWGSELAVTLTLTLTCMRRHAVPAPGALHICTTQCIHACMLPQSRGFLGSQHQQRKALLHAQIKQGLRPGMPGALYVVDGARWASC